MMPLPWRCEDSRTLPGRSGAVRVLEGEATGPRSSGALRSEPLTGSGRASCSPSRLLPAAQRGPRLLCSPQHPPKDTRLSPRATYLRELLLQPRGTSPPPAGPLLPLPPPLPGRPQGRAARRSIARRSPLRRVGGLCARRRCLAGSEAAAGLSAAARLGSARAGSRGGAEAAGWGSPWFKERRAELNGQEP